MRVLSDVVPMTVALTLGSISVLLLAVLGLRRALAVRRKRPVPDACTCPAHELLEATRSLIDASRRSSDAVLRALDAALRRRDGGVESVLVFVPSGEELVCAYAGGTRAEHFRRMHLSRSNDERLPALAARAGCRAVLDAPAHALIPTDRCAIAVPMLDARGLRAVAYASSSQFDAAIDEEAIVRTVTHATMPYAIALEREADRVDATHDGLTGLLGARAFRRLLHDEMSRDAGRSMLSVWFVDTDRFKDVNDRFGHRAGDAVLQAMAALLRSHLVAGRDVGARNGGDEFCALVRDATKSAAIERARAFCDAVRAFDFGVDLAVTASVGVATFPHDGATSSALLEVADAAMYHSKRSGRDRVSYALAAGSYASA